MKVQGIHHISGIVKHPQENIDFYTSLLGLRMIKKAVNFDDANTYHFYFGNHNGDKGTAITYFPWNNRAKEGTVGDGQVGVVTYAIPFGSIDFWERRLTSFKIKFERRFRFNQTYLYFKDLHGIENELVESNQGITNEYEYNGVTSSNAIKGFAGAILYSKKPLETKEFLINILGLDISDEDSEYIRLSMDSQIVGKTVDLFKGSIGVGRNSTGTNHHIAFTIEDEEIELFKKKVEDLGIRVSEIKNRDFFRSIYFKEPGGIIIELASSKPGFGSKPIDDKALELYLPEHFESDRALLEATLTPVFVKEVDTLTEYPYETVEEFNNYYNHQELLKQINEFVKIAKTRELTEEETIKRQELRAKYIKQITGSVAQMADTIMVENEDGSTSKLEKRKKVTQ